MSFSVLGLDPKILQAVKEAGYTEPTPIQARRHSADSRGARPHRIAQTGTGKTAAFTLPILTRLAAPVGEAAARHPRAGARAHARTRCRSRKTSKLRQTSALRVATIFGGVGEHPQIHALRAGTASDCRLPRPADGFDAARYADFSQLQFLVLDEADRMLDMGFLPSIRQIVAHCRKNDRPCFSPRRFRRKSNRSRTNFSTRQSGPNWPPRKSRRNRDAICL